MPLQSEARVGIEWFVQTTATWTSRFRPNHEKQITEESRQAMLPQSEARKQQCRRAEAPVNKLLVGEIARNNCLQYPVTTVHRGHR